MMDRRGVLKAGLAVMGTGLAMPGLARERYDYSLDIRPGQATLLEVGGAKAAIWGYDGQVPGPMIRARRGKPLKVTVTNNLPQPTSVHWHGIRIVNAMDGVAGLTQAPIEPGETFVYEYVPPDAGTFWYHSHMRSWEQQARGLYGPLIVEENVPVGIDRDLTIVADDWRLTEAGMLHEESFGNIGERAHAGRLGNVLTLNGKPYERLTVLKGERVRLRLINSANARVLSFKLAGIEPWLVAVDGQPLAAVRLGDATLRLAPAQRADLVFDVTAETGSELAISEVSGREALVAGYLEVDETEMTGRPVHEGIPTLPSNDVPLPDRSKARAVDLKMTGGAMRFLDSAIFKGETLDGRTLVREHGQAWALNGIAGTAIEPLFTAARNEHIMIRMHNDTLWPHAMHVHGFHFVEMARKPANEVDFSMSEAVGEQPAPLRDTILMQADEEVEIGFVADNPGSWLLHCHMAEHMAGGMVTWFQVED
jgi:FtsP/CotA-like multicopper oxidase with cupredoxin domain